MKLSINCIKKSITEFFRFHEKVIIEAELTELRNDQNYDWTSTKHHLKLAKETPDMELCRKISC